MSVARQHGSHVRFLVIFALFLASAFSYGDRVVLSIAGIRLAADLHLTSMQMGYLFSAFSWAYVAAQLPAGWMLDRFGTRRVYGTSIVVWSAIALLSGLAGLLPGMVAFFILVGTRFLSGLAQAPVFPGNGRIVAAWFPAAERGTASAIFNASQYFAFVLFAPVIGWIAQTAGWKECFWLLGGLGLALAWFWLRVIHDVETHPKIDAVETEHIRSGGGLCTIGLSAGVAPPAFSLRLLGMLLKRRLILGVYLGQFCINTLTVFFLTWFPVYLSKGRHMSIANVGFVSALPAVFGCLGGLLGGVTSDALLRQSRSLNIARKTPIVGGMLLAMTLALCNYTDSQTVILVIMSLAFFGKGFGALGWTLVSDTSPQGMVGVNGGFFNLFGNVAGITTPIVIGYLVQTTGSFRIALDFVAVTALGAIASYLLIAGDIHRLRPEELDILPATADTI